MISEDKKRDFDATLGLVDYHASFWNPEGVKKIKEYRESLKEESIKEAEEFVKTAVTGEFKNNPLIDAIKKIRQKQKEEPDEGTGLLSSINLNKLIKESI